MYCDEEANTGCGQAGLSYAADGYNVSRINGLIRDIVQPALDAHRVRTRTRSDQKVLEFGAKPPGNEPMVAAGSDRTKRVVFR
jgi:hypothetical protein